MNKIKYAILGVLVMGFSVVDCLAGKNYGRTEFWADVTVENWVAISNVTSAIVNGGGTYTSGTNAFVYRVAGSNSAGRLPSSTNVAVTFVGSTTGNAVKLTWERYQGLSKIVILRSTDAGTNFSFFRIAQANPTSFTDTGLQVFNTNNFEVGPLIPDPEVPWIDGSVSNLFARRDTTNTFTDTNTFDNTVTFKSNIVSISGGVTSDVATEAFVNAIAVSTTNAFQAADIVISSAFVTADSTQTVFITAAYKADDTIISNAFVTADSTQTVAITAAYKSDDTIISNAFVSADSTQTVAITAAYIAADVIVSNAFVTADSTQTVVITAAYRAADTVVSNAFVTADSTQTVAITAAYKADDTIISNAFGTADSTQTVTITTAYLTADSTQTVDITIAYTNADAVVAVNAQTANDILSNNLFTIITNIPLDARPATGTVDFASNNATNIGDLSAATFSLAGETVLPTSLSNFTTNNATNVNFNTPFTFDSVRVAKVDTAADGTSTNLSNYFNGPGFVTAGGLADVFTASNNTYATGTIQALALGTITNDAVASTDIVNRRTLDEAVTEVSGHFSSTTNQKPANTNVTVIKFNREDISPLNIIHSVSTNTEVFTMTNMVNKRVLWIMVPQWERTTAGGSAVIDFWAQHDLGGGSFSNVPFSTIKKKFTSDESGTSTLNYIMILNTGDKIRFMQKISDVGQGLGLIFTDAQNGVSETPSVILTVNSGN